MNNEMKPNSRRKFLLHASLGGAGAAAAVVAGQKIATGEQAAPAADKPRGYHVSEHVLKYYKTTQI
ncbi:MAG: twin-arginine translocation signal domain-containing protein [Betaproteobacteria bacterium]|nr:twin-arginine translocation signal domain-containing protein [Betaproteobacteria bacterium]